LCLTCATLRTPCLNRRAVPLALALLNVSAPALGAMDALSRLSHDTDVEVAQNAVLALGARALTRSSSPAAAVRLITAPMIPAHVCMS
jgi:hypothetical protein